MRPTSRAPAPSAITLCVSLGTSETIRCGGRANDSVRPRSSVSLRVGTAEIYRVLRSGVAETSDERMVAEVASKPADLAAAVAKLSPEEAAFFLARLEAMMVKRKLQLTGYLVAMAVWLLGMVGALIYFGTHDGFVGWVFILPFALMGLTIWAFGKWAQKVGTSVTRDDKK